MKDTIVKYYFHIHFDENKVKSVAEMLKLELKLVLASVPTTMLIALIGETPWVMARGHYNNHRHWLASRRYHSTDGCKVMLKNGYVSSFDDEDNDNRRITKPQPTQPKQPKQTTALLKARIAERVRQLSVKHLHCDVWKSLFKPATAVLTEVSL